MSFTKRYYNFRSIKEVYNQKQMEGLRRYFRIDGLIFEDKDSSHAFELYEQGREDELITFLTNE